MPVRGREMERRRVCVWAGFEIGDVGRAECRVCMYVCGYVGMAVGRGCIKLGTLRFENVFCYS